MLEMKIKIAAPDLAAAINSLAVALANGSNSKPIEKTATVASAPVAQPATPTVPVNPTPTPATVPPVANPTMPVSGVPLSATPTQAATPFAHTTPVAQSAPTVPIAQSAPTVPVAQPASTVPVANTAQFSVPTSAPRYTLDMIAAAGATLINAGKMDQLMQLLAKFGVASLTEIAPDKYGAVASELRALGARI